MLAVYSRYGLPFGTAPAADAGDTGAMSATVSAIAPTKGSARRRSRDGVVVVCVVMVLVLSVVLILVLVVVGDGPEVAG
jgi:hypothetical protein